VEVEAELEALLEEDVVEGFHAAVVVAEEASVRAEALLLGDEVVSLGAVGGVDLAGEAEEVIELFLRLTSCSLKAIWVFYFV
jgi:hypothetical protein